MALQHKEVEPVYCWVVVDSVVLLARRSSSSMLMSCFNMLLMLVKKLVRLDPKIRVVCPLTIPTLLQGGVDAPNGALLQHHTLIQRPSRNFTSPVQGRFPLALETPVVSTVVTRTRWRANFQHSLYSVPPAPQSASP